MKIGSKVYAGLGIFLLVGLFFIFKSQEQTPPPATNPTGAEQVPFSASSSANENSQTFELIVKDKKLVSGPETLQVKKGDEVTIKITVNEDEELHIHGYDKSVELTKDIPAELKFTADLTGHFPYELENSKTDIGAVDVLP